MDKVKALNFEYKLRLIFLVIDTEKDGVDPKKEIIREQINVIMVVIMSK